MKKAALVFLLLAGLMASAVSTTSHDSPAPVPHDWPELCPPLCG